MPPRGGLLVLIEGSSRESGEGVASREPRVQGSGGSNLIVYLSNPPSSEPTLPGSFPQEGSRREVGVESGKMFVPDTLEDCFRESKVM